MNNDDGLIARLARVAEWYESGPGYPRDFEEGRQRIAADLRSAIARLSSPSGIGADIETAIRDFMLPFEESTADRRFNEGLRVAIEAVRSARSQSRMGEGWQGIESAPKDQKVLAGYHNRLGKWRTVTACYHTHLEWSDDYEWTIADGDHAPEGWYEESETHETLLLLDRPPTHWQPLPAPPSLTPKEQ